MGDSITIYTSFDLTDGDVEQEVVQLGGAVVKGVCVLDSGPAVLWPMVDSVEDTDPELLATMVAIVGAPLRACLVLELSHEPGTYALAGRLLEQVAARYPCVVSRTHCCEPVLVPHRALAILREDRSLYERCPLHGSALEQAGFRRRRRWSLR